METCFTNVWNEFVKWEYDFPIIDISDSLKYYKYYFHGQEVIFIFVYKSLTNYLDKQEDGYVWEINQRVSFLVYNLIIIYLIILDNSIRNNMEVHSGLKWIGID